MRLIIITLLLLSFLLCSCQHQTENAIKIDLTQKKTDIRYSEFVDSASYLTLYSNDSCIISRVKRLYIDSAYTILSDRSGNGICIFFDNKFQCNIANYGRGPQEFISITDFCLDKANKHICIYDIEGGKLLKYNYQGKFVCEYPFRNVMRSFANIKGKFICIQAAYLREMQSGVWTADSNGKFVKVLLPGNSDNVFEMIYPYYFNYYNDEGISYYDRYDNKLFFITPDSAHLKYRFDLIPALPQRLKKRDDKGLQDYFMLATCYEFKKYLLLFYGSTEKFYQVLYHKTDSTYRVTDNLVNDLLPADTYEVSEHYIDENTLAVELGAQEDDYNLHFQILHIKQQE
ncbi:MAG: 6-bladed beta-propeller [Odoribacter sp.]|nr:6-bladed beta-propeller [Odoribacter sp.]